MYCTHFTQTNASFTFSELYTHNLVIVLLFLYKLPLSFFFHTFYFIIITCITILFDKTVIKTQQDLLRHDLLILLSKFMRARRVNKTLYLQIQSLTPHKKLKPYI